MKRCTRHSSKCRLGKSETGKIWKNSWKFNKVINNCYKFVQYFISLWLQCVCYWRCPPTFRTTLVQCSLLIKSFVCTPRKSWNFPPLLHSTIKIKISIFSGVQKQNLCSEFQLILYVNTRGIWKVMHIHPYNFTQWSENKDEGISVNIRIWGFWGYHVSMFALMR